MTRAMGTASARYSNRHRRWHPRMPCVRPSQPMPPPSVRPIARRVSSGAQGPSKAGGYPTKLQQFTRESLPRVGGPTLLGLSRRSHGSGWFACDGAGTRRLKVRVGR
jgi:hypothetical protein